MVPAKDSRKISPARRVWIGCAVVCLALSSGCSRLRPFRHDDRPVFGTETAANAPRGEKATLGDLYAERVGHSQNSSKVATARRRKAGSTAAPETTGQVDDSQSSQTDHLMVSLQPPVAIPSAAVASRSAIEERTESVEGVDSNRPPLETASTAPAARLATITHRGESPKASTPTVASLLSESRGRLDGLSSYRVEMSHQERVNGRLNPAEDVVMSIRRTPKSVRLEWLDGPNKGREVLYSADTNNGLMHVRMSNPLVPRISIPPESPLATTNSRHPITEAGFDTIVENMELSFTPPQSGTPSRGEVTYAGLEQPESLDKPCHKLVRITPSRETWLVYLDPKTHLPALVQATSENGELLERYVFRNPSFDLPELASADAFSPDARWGPAKGLFGRIARANSDARKVSEPR